MSELNALVGVDFSLIGTHLHAAYEKKGDDGYAVLLMPSEQIANNGVSIGEVINDITKMIEGMGDKPDTNGMQADLQNGLSGLSGNDNKDGASFDLNKLIVKLQMAYLYIYKANGESILEYAFQLQILSKNVIPSAIRSVVSVDNISVSIWNTNRQKVIDKMALVTINDYLGITKNEETTES